MFFKAATDFYHDFLKLHGNFCVKKLSCSIRILLERNIINLAAVSSIEGLKVSMRSSFIFEWNENVINSKAFIMKIDSIHNAKK